MNLRIVSFLSSESEEDVKELVADFAEALLARGYANDVEDTSSPMKSLIVVRENDEVLNGAPEEYFQKELNSALMTVIPTDVTGKIVKENKEKLENLTEE